MKNPKNARERFDLFGNLIVKIEEDFMGSLHIRPVSENRRKQAAATMEANGYPTPDSPDAGTVYVQNDIRETLETLALSEKQVSDIESGYQVRVKIAPWLYRHLCGWQAD